MARRTEIIGLPTYTNAFVGRTHNVQAIASLLQAGSQRLITLLGPGGIGKTRLAAYLGEQLATCFADGGCFVRLDMVHDAGQVPLYIGTRLGLQVRSAQQWMDEIIDYLRPKHYLLILDNLEQVLEAAVPIGRLISACPRLTILVTSREVLGLSYEVEYPVDSLSRPNSHLFPGPEELRKFAAIDLFVQTARMSLPGFELTERNAPAIVGICEELEGMPLPIELAAARVKLFDPEHILQQLKRNQDLLKTRARDVRPRHRTIDNTIRWSYDLLDPAEQQFFQQLALFRGGFTLEALGDIYPGNDPLERVESLLNKSLILRDTSSSQPRFRMLKLIRDFGIKQVRNHPAAAEYYQRFADYFYRFVTAPRPGEEETAWLQRAEAEYDNLGVALDWLIDSDPSAAARMGARFWRFYLQRGYLKEGLVLVERLLQLTDIDREVTARLMSGAGVLSQNLGDYPAALEFFNQSRATWAELRHDREISLVLCHIAWSQWRVGDYDASVANSQKALSLAEQLEDASIRAKALNNLAWVYFHQGRYARAEQLQREILQIYAEQPNPRGTAFAHTNLGWALLYTGQWAEAEQSIRAGIDAFTALKDQQLLAFTYLVRSDFLFLTGERAAARELLLAQCLPVFTRIGYLGGEAASRLRLGQIAFLEQDTEAARSYFQSAAELFQRSRDRLGCATIRLWSAKLARRSGAEQRAASLLHSGLDLVVPMQANSLIRAIYFELGQHYRTVNQPARAAACLAAAAYYGGQCGPHTLERLLPHLAPHQEWIATALGSPELAGQLGELLPRLPLAEAVCHWRNLAFSAPTPAAPDDPGGREEPEPPFVLKLRRIVQAHLGDPDFSVRELCGKVHLSHSQLHRKLKAHRGQSATQFIRQLRMEQARVLLAETDRPVTAIAYDVGFRDPDYFYRVFKQTYQLTPGDFRKLRSEA